MEETNQIEQEIVIVGSRYGDFTDVLEPYYEKGEPIEPKDIENILGSTTVYLQRMNNTSDPYAVGVFLNTEMQLGFVWKDQSFPLYEWMLNTDIPYVIANIKRVISRHGIMIADVVLPFWLKDCPRKAIGIDMDWARNIPLTVPSVKQQSLNLAIALLCDELPLVTTWSDSLKKRIENVNRYLPSDLSAKHIQKSLVLYEKMRMSPIKKVRDACDDMLNAMVSRGSEKNMKRWAKKFLPEYFNFVSESELFGVFEAANYTLERVEELLNSAPDNLFYSYKFDRVVFAFRLYYASLPEELYDRLLMLLAVREAMLGKEKKAEDKDIDAKVYNALATLKKEGEIVHLYDFTWPLIAMNEDKDLPSFDTPTSYLGYMRKIGVKNLPSRSTISKYYDKAHGQFPNCTFEDADTTETTRRNNVGKRFINLVKRE